MAGWPVCFLASRLGVTERVLCFFGSCRWLAGAHALGPRLGPPIIGARRGVGLVASCFRRFRFAFASLWLGGGGLNARGPKDLEPCASATRFANGPAHGHS